MKGKLNLKGVPVPLKIVRNDITKMMVDAIVNVANEPLLVCDFDSYIVETN